MLLNYWNNINVMHQGFLKMKDKIEEYKIFYHGINRDILELLNLCDVCTQKNIKFYKREPCKQIVFNRPKDKVDLDLTYLPINILENIEYKYMLNCNDHFSKFVVSFLIENKLGKVVSEKLKIYFGKYLKKLESTIVPNLKIK